MRIVSHFCSPGLQQPRRSVTSFCWGLDSELNLSGVFGFGLGRVPATYLQLERPFMLGSLQLHSHLALEAWGLDN